MVAIESVGSATKNCDSGIDRPGVLPFAQLTPAELVRADGTNTWYASAESTYR